MQNQMWVKLGGDGSEVRIFSPIEAADYCGGADRAVSVQTIARWRRTGWLRYLGPIGRGFYYTKDALDECLELRGYESRIQKETHDNRR
jgi:hypothetical protein